MNRLFGKFHKESGVVIVEATFVFPIMFIILFILIYMGNAFYEKAQIEAVVVEKAIEGANYCTDPILETLKTTGSVPELSGLDTEPYRYIFGGMSEIEEKISGEVKESINSRTNTFFGNMKPELSNTTAKIANYESHIIYSTFSVEVEYNIEFPIKFLGEDSSTILTINACSEVPVNDTTEFIRNTDMAIDLLESTQWGSQIVGKIKNAFGKVNDFIHTFAQR